MPTAPDSLSKHLLGHRTGFCFASSFDVYKKCPLSELMFTPCYDQNKFEEHVESRWKVCPMCSEQFPPGCDQQGFWKACADPFWSECFKFWLVTFYYELIIQLSSFKKSSQVGPKETTGNYCTFYRTFLTKSLSINIILTSFNLTRLRKEVLMFVYLFPSLQSIFF